jgi:hypothetical protein
VNRPTPTLADAPSIAEEDLHRQRASLAKRAEANYSGAGWTVYQLWREMNQSFFGRQMRHCEIQFSSIHEQFGTWKAPTILLSNSLLQRDGSRWWLHHERFGAYFPQDALLRQMVFQYISAVRNAEITDRAGTPVEPLGENESWLQEVTRLSEEMELDQPTSPEEARWWPYSVRREGYYGQDQADSKSNPPLIRG